MVKNTFPSGWLKTNLNKDTSSYTTNDLNSSEIIIKSLELEKNSILYAR